MKKTWFLAALAMAACGAVAEDTASLPDQVVLLDVQGLWGGVDLWIAKDGKATCRAVGPPAAGEQGLQETRYAFALTAEQQAELKVLLDRHSFFTIEITGRAGVPDESRPLIFVLAGDRKRAVAKWGNDRHSDFDPLYRFLLGLAAAGRAGEPMSRGAYDRAWQPGGFPSNDFLRALAEPGLDE